MATNKYEAMLVFSVVNGEESTAPSCYSGLGGFKIFLKSKDKLKIHPTIC